MSEEITRPQSKRTRSLTFEGPELQQLRHLLALNDARLTAEDVLLRILGVKQVLAKLADEEITGPSKQEKTYVS